MWWLAGIQVVMVLLVSSNAYAGLEFLSSDLWNGRGSDNLILLLAIVVLLLGAGVAETTAALTKEARESGCSRRSILLQFLTSFLAVALVILGLYFLLTPIELRGVAGVLVTFGGSATIFGSAFALLLFGNYLHENPDKLK